MKLTKFGHACVRLEGPGGVLVIDPGGRTEDASVAGADAILVTHEHFDHFAEGRLRAATAANRDLRVFTVAAVAGLLAGLGRQVHVVGHGDSFTAAGFEVQAHGTWHARVHPDVPAVANTGFLVDGAVFHPGDALTVPDEPVDTLLVPVHAAWFRLSEIIDWVRQVAPRRAVGVHDGDLNAGGLAKVGGFLGPYGPRIGARYVRVEPFEDLDVPRSDTARG